MKRVVALAIIVMSLVVSTAVAKPTQDDGFVAVIDMKMMIAPGTLAFLEKSLEKAETDGAKALIVKLDTPGGMLNTTQEMTQTIFSSKIPIFIYVAPSGGAAISAGVFITLAGHIAAMSPGTSIGAAHPVTGEGKDIEGDMRAKTENMTIAMVKSISEQRGRNVEWAEKAVKDSSSATDEEALKLKVIDIVATDVGDLLKQAAGKKVTIGKDEIELGDYSGLRREIYEIEFRDKMVNVLANPNIAALLWLGATTGLSLELYNPGAIFPGVVGIICLILALAVSQIIPISQGGVLLMIVGALLIGAEIYVGSGILGFGGLIAMVLGALYLVDVTQAPGMAVSPEIVIPLAVVMGGTLLYVMSVVLRDLKGRRVTGKEGMIGMIGRVVDPVTSDDEGRVFLNGEYWKAVLAEGEEGELTPDTDIVVVAEQSGLVLEVKRELGQD